MRGFRAGQHLRLRVFFDGRGVFESHPFSIMNASSGSSCLRASDLDLYGAPTSAYDKSSREWGGGMEETPGVVLGVRVRGDWTKALNEYALKECENAQSFIQCSHSSSSSTARRPLQAVVPVQVMFDGPYGGCTLDLPSYERVLLVAGGSGATFAVGALDELVASCCLSEGMKEGVVKTEKVVFVWCIKSSGRFPVFLVVVDLKSFWGVDSVDKMDRTAVKCDSDDSFQARVRSGDHRLCDVSLRAGGGTRYSWDGSSYGRTSGYGEVSWEDGGW